MKKCTYCGTEYPDEAVTCATDQWPLETIGPVAEVEVAEVPTDSSGDPIQFNKETDLPEGFAYFATRDSHAAVKLFWRMDNEGIVFWAEKVEEEVETAVGTKIESQVKIFVRAEDMERAWELYNRGGQV